MKRLVACILGVSLFAPAPTAAAEGRYIVRTSQGVSGLVSACRWLGACSVVRALDGTLGQLFLVTTPLEVPVNTLRSLLQLTGGILHIEKDRLVSIGARAVLKGVPAGLNDRRPVDFAGSLVWNGYVAQPSSAIVRLEETRARWGGQGAGVVAVIDTGIDSRHPALRSVVLPGYDFLTNQPGANTEEGDVTQSTAAVLDGNPGLVNTAVAAVLSLPLLSALATDDKQAFGHGTSVAGLIHLVAPRAILMPLRAFRADGSGYLSDVLRAMYHATSQQVQIIHMSFSFASPSPELAQAVDYSRRRGIVMVASAGNNGNQEPVYPAALPGMIGVGSTNLFDQRSSFSNYGGQLVWLAAPGEQLITTYPYGSYAAVAGTSFSAPLVTGAVSLLLERRAVNQTDAREALRHAQPVTLELGSGRLDLVRVVGAWLGQ